MSVDALRGEVLRLQAQMAALRSDMQLAIEEAMGHDAAAPFVDPPEAPAPRPYDLVLVSTTVVKVKGGAVDNAIFPVAGVWHTVGAGTATLGSDITISANTWILLKEVSTDSGTVVTLEAQATKPNATDSGSGFTRYHALWYVPFSGGAITGRHDYRNLPGSDRTGN